MTQYMIVTKVSRSDIEQAVEDLLKEGWVLSGSIASQYIPEQHIDAHQVWVQAMTKDNK